MENSILNQQFGGFPVHHNAGGSNGQTVSPLKGAWTPLEDSALKERVRVYGQRNWAAIAKGVPGRTGRQCRERWINKLRPGIKEKNKWTEEEDNNLIHAHMIFGNSWKAIASFLGRSENSIKNHWNATKRSLGSRCWIKNKTKEKPFGQFTALEEYIGNLRVNSQPEQLGSDPGHQQQVFPNTVVEPLVSNPHAVDMCMKDGGVVPSPMMQDGLVHPNVLASTTSFNPPNMGMYSNSATLDETQAMQSQVPFYRPTFTDHLNYPVQQNMVSCQHPLGTNINFNYPGQQNSMSYQDPQGTYKNLNYPLSENVTCQSSYQANSNWFNNEIGASSIGGNIVPFSENVGLQCPNLGNSNGISNQVGESSAVNNIVPLSENAVWQSSNPGNSNGFNNEVCESSAGGNTLSDDIDDVQVASIMNWFIPFEDDDALEFDKFV